jgi:hypothetical protein
MERFLRLGLHAALTCGFQTVRKSGRRTHKWPARVGKGGKPRRRARFAVMARVTAPSGFHAIQGLPTGQQMRDAKRAGSAASWRGSGLLLRCGLIG